MGIEDWYCGLGLVIGIGDWELGFDRGLGWGLEFRSGIGDLDLRVGLGNGIAELDFGCELGLEFGYWDWGLGIVDWGLRLGIGDWRLGFWGWLFWIEIGIEIRN